MTRTVNPSGIGWSAALALSLLLGSSARASEEAEAAPAKPPLMTIKIFNDNPGQYIFPVLTTGAGPRDIWLQAIFKVPAAQTDTKTYARAKNFRIYINPTVGIAPNTSVTLTLPLYTQLAKTVDPTKPDQYVDWWNGGTVLLYANDKPTPPKALQEALKRPTQREITSLADAAVRPQCPKCRPAPTPRQPLKFYSDDSDLPKNDPTQLLEYTLGARVALEVKNPATDPPNTLDLRNVDFDVSYVNIAHLPAAMGPFRNDQVGYVGTPQRIGAFSAALRGFLEDYPGWPRFVRTYADGTKETILKLASPLEIFARLGPKLPPPDLEPPPRWPDRLWPPVQAMRTNWMTFAGTVDPLADGRCTSSAAGDTFCDAIADAKRLMKANYDNYVSIFAKHCVGKPVALTDDLMISHIYGWTPFTEAETGTGCPARANLLENTPGYEANDYARYLKIKQQFDKLNYGTLRGVKYTFNPWVELIHGRKYVNAPNVYAYSVDDAVGNIQADGLGFIIDVGSTKNLENPLPAAPPVTINYAIDGPNGVRFSRYRICKNDPAVERRVNPSFSSFIINANDPASCPIYLFDDKTPAQLYTFTVTRKPPFRIFADQSKANWTAETAQPIDCSGNTAAAPFQPSSKTWCCDRSARNGVFAFSTPEPHNAHQSLNHYVIAHGPEPTMATSDQSCSNGR